MRPHIEYWPEPSRAGDEGIVAASAVAVALAGTLIVFWMLLIGLFDGVKHSAPVSAPRFVIAEAGK